MGFGSDGLVDEEKVINFADLFKPATELSAVNNLRIGIHGKAKVGKSYFTLTPVGYHIIVIDTENAMRLTVRLFNEEKRKKIHVFEALKYSNMETGEIDLVGSLEMLYKAITAAHRYINEHSDEKFVLVIDSATDIWDWLGIWLDEKPGTQHINGGEKVSRLEWGKANKRYAEAFYQLVTSGAHVIMTFRSKDAVGKDGSDLGYVIPRWQKNTEYWLDLIVKLEKIAGTRTLQFMGSRFCDDIKPLENPDWEKLVGHLSKTCKVNFT